MMRKKKKIGKAGAGNGAGTGAGAGRSLEIHAQHRRGGVLFAYRGRHERRLLAQLFHLRSPLRLFLGQFQV